MTFVERPISATVLAFTVLVLLLGLRPLLRVFRKPA